MVKIRELFETDFIIQGNRSDINSTRTSIQVNKHCMTELLLLDNTKVLCLFDTGSTVTLLSESVIKSSEYLSSLLVLDCQTIRSGILAVKSKQTSLWNCVLELRMTTSSTQLL